MILAGGGFHNVRMKTLNPKRVEGQTAFISKRQYNLLVKHYCGVKGCLCYSYPKMLGTSKDGLTIIEIPVGTITD